MVAMGSWGFPPLLSLQQLEWMHSEGAPRSTHSIPICFLCPLSDVQPLVSLLMASTS